MAWSAVDQTTDPEIWVSIHYSSGTVTHIQVTDTLDYEGDPSIAMAPNGNIIVVWEVSDLSVYYAVLSEGGTIIKGPMALSHGDNHDPCVAVTPNGVVFAVWESGPYPDDVAYVTMDVNGDNVIPVTRISGVKDGIDDPTVAASTQNGGDDRVVIAWEDYDPDKGADQIAFTILDSGANTLVPKTKITDTAYGNNDVNAAILPNGYAVIVWEAAVSEDNDVGYAVIDTPGATVGPVRLISRPLDIDAPGVAATPSGNIVIVWDEAAGDGQPDDIMFAILDGSGNVVKSPDKLTTSDKDEDEPDVAVDLAGNVVVIYEQELSPTDRLDFVILHMQAIFGPEGLTDGTHDVDLEGDNGPRQVATKPHIPPRPVGGYVMPVSKLEVIAPYLALAGLVGALTSFVAVKKNRKD